MNPPSTKSLNPPSTKSLAELAQSIESIDATIGSISIQICGNKNSVSCLMDQVRNRDLTPQKVNKIAKKIRYLGSEVALLEDEIAALEQQKTRALERLEDGLNLVKEIGYICVQDLENASAAVTLGDMKMIEMTFPIKVLGGLAEHLRQSLSISGFSVFV